jgi:hypothetical protein
VVGWALLPAEPPLTDSVPAEEAPLPPLPFEPLPLPPPPLPLKKSCLVVPQALASRNEVETMTMTDSGDFNCSTPVALRDPLPDKNLYSLSPSQMRH